MGALLRRLDRRPMRFKSADLKYPRGFYHGRLALALGKFRSLLFVSINTGKTLPVLVKNSHLPVFVLPASIFPQRRAFPCGFRFRHHLNISMATGARKYQFGQYFASNQIILHYRIGCNGERHCILN